MVERLVITAMGKQCLAEKLYDRILTALKNLSLDSSDEKRAAHVVSAVIANGEYTEFPDHGSWKEPAGHN